MTGTLVNAAAVIVGSLIGLWLHTKFPKRVGEIVFQALGLFTLFIGIVMALKATEMLFTVFSLVLGGITGELLKLDQRLANFSNKLGKLMKSENSKFSEGFITSFLLFCMGSMTILGTFEEGVGQEPKLLMAKSVMDGFSSVALAAAMGAGVLLSAVPLLIYQGALTFLAMYLGQTLPAMYITEISAVGGILLIGLGINILEIKQLKILNLLPALVYIALFLVIFK
ncbi:MAG TPA: DUF554 domain-containing protein [Bacteroidales bacterium]|nr:DUF554 domain-containing protein [Bacteroidales bacterium]